jgi:hypothetical protein
MIFITRRSDGTPQASPVTGGVDDSGRIVISTYPERAKTRNAHNRPDVSVLVISDDWNDGHQLHLEVAQATGRIEMADPRQVSKAEAHDRRRRSRCREVPT